MMSMGKCALVNMAKDHKLNKLHGLDIKIHATLDADRPVIGPDISGESLVEGVGDTACNYAEHSRGGADGPEFGGVIGFLKEAKRIGVSVVSSNDLGGGVIVDHVK